MTFKALNLHQKTDFKVQQQGNKKSKKILIPSNIDVDINILKITTDTNGRILLFHCEIEKSIYVIVNIYAPTKDDAKAQNAFLYELIKLIEEYSDNPLIIGGDYNICLDNNKDKKGGTLDKESAYRVNLHNFMEEFCLSEIWRIRNPDKIQFSWRNSGPKGLVQSRLDFWLISNFLEYDVTKCCIHPGLLSDHSILKLSLNLTETQGRGRGTWKFNNNLLKDFEYIDLVKKQVKSVKEIFFEDKRVRWEFLKCQIRSETIIFARNKAKQSRHEEKILQEKIQNLETALDANSEEQISEYNQLRREWENLQDIKTKGAIIRSKAQLVEEGEKNSKYFLNLEKRNYNRKCMKTIINRDGLEVTDPKNILNEQANFFENLYTTRKIDSISNTKIEEKYLKNPSIPKLDQDVKSNLDLPINIDELSHALKNMKNDKSPGLDGFTTNFYKFFWTDLKNLLYETLTYSFQQGELPCGLRRGVLSLIPKKDKDLRYLKSWRPVSLLATDYKILAKALSIRLEQVMPSLISCDQVGYIKGRFIGENVRIIEDILSYTTTKHIPGLLILIDFEKAFDTVEWNFLFKSLKSYNIGSEFISWVKLLYNNITSCTVNNGHLSPSFKLSRGVRQGCPLSAFLFILVSEIISLSLKSDKGVKGIKIAGTKYKICQLADDTTIFLENLSCLEEAINHFNAF